MSAPRNVSPLSSPFMYHAEQAVRHVKSVIYFAGNRIADAVATGGASYVCVSAQRYFNRVDSSMHPLDKIHQWAAGAEKARCGNCGEQSALAFTYLERQPKIRPIEIMYFLKPLDHNFVVIGRVPGSIESDVKTWGRNAVVCDPWSGKSYAAVDLPQHWPGGIPACFFRL